MSDLRPWLQFKRPMFKSGHNVTVRLGDKWAGRIYPEDVVQIHDTYARDSYLFDAFIVDVQVLKICDIPVETLENEHDPSCRTHEGLIRELRRVYRKSVSSRDTVTVITFEQCEPDPGEHDDPIEPPKTH